MRYISLGGELLGAIAIGAICQPAAAQVIDSPVSSVEPTAGEETAALREELDAMRVREQQARDQIEVLEQRLTALERVLGGGGVPLSPEQEMAMRGRGLIATGVTPRYNGEVVEALAQDGAATASAPMSAAQATEGGEEEIRREPAPAESVEAVTRDTQGYFGERFGVELGVTYGHFDDARINLSGFLALDAIFLGLISIDQQTSDIITTDLTVRYAPSNRLQFDVDVPYLYRSSIYQSGGAGGDASGLAEAKVTADGVGDISGGISYRLIPESVGFPDVVINARVKAPTGRDPFGVELREVPGTEGNLKVPTSLSTGTGTWAASGGVSMLKTIDPMIVFGNLTYYHNFTQRFADIDEATGDQPGRIAIGDAIQAGAGVAFALNEFSSLSTSFSLRFGDETRLRHTNDENWRTVIGSSSTVGILNLGATFAVSRKASILANIGIGVTEDAPDMTLSVRLPYRF